MSKVKLLIVDDEKEFVGFLTERLELRGIKPLVAYSGEEALEIAQKENIDAAIVDLKMPGMDGLACIQKLKETNKKIKTVLLTGFGDEKVKQATEAMDSQYFDKGEMESFWEFVKSLPQKMEQTMAAAGMAEGGDMKDADEIIHEDD